MSALIGIICLAALGAIAIYSLKSDIEAGNSVTPLEENERMLTYLRQNPDHVVSTADTEYLQHRSY